MNHPEEHPNQKTTTAESQLVEIVVGWANQELTAEEAVGLIEELLTDLKRRSDQGDSTAADELTAAVQHLEFLTAGMLYGIETPPSEH